MTDTELKQAVERQEYANYRTIQNQLENAEKQLKELMNQREHMTESEFDTAYKELKWKEDDARRRRDSAFDSWHKALKDT